MMASENDVGGIRTVLYVYSGKARPGGIGLDLVVRQQLEALAESGYRIVFVSRGQFRHPNVTNISIPVTPANLISFLSSKHYYNAQNRFFSQIGAWIAGMRKFDLVISWTRQSRNLFRAANRLGIRSFLNCPGWHYNYPLENARWEKRPWPSFQKCDFDEEYSSADTLLATSEFAGTTFIANGIPDNKVVSIGRAADPERYQNPARSFSPFRAIFFAQVSERKGIFEAFEIWERAAIPDSELWVVGSIPKELTELIETKLPINAKLFGYRKDAEALLGQCHVQILPSRQEGMAKSLVEGAACGLVTLATRESGFPVIEGKSGYYIDRNSIDQAAIFLRQISQSENSWQEMSAYSSAYVRQNLTWPMFRQRFLKAIE